MPKHFFITGTAENLSALMNECCQGKRHFQAVSREEIGKLLSRGTKEEAGKILVLSDESGPRGACHIFASNKGQQGYIAYLLAMPGEEHLVWPALLDAAHSALSRASTITIGSPYTPLYQAAEGRFQPLWGTVETLEICSTDILLKEFLLRRGYAIIEDYVTMTKQLLEVQEDYSPRIKSPPAGAVLELLRGDDCWYNAYDWYGQNSAGEFGLRNASLRALVLRKGHRIVGHTAWYPMRHAGGVALCDFAVSKKHRGRGLGSMLFNHTMRQLVLEGYLTCELFIDPRQSPLAQTLYHKAGFREAALWHEMIRHG